jgi:hypothetical protein
MTQMLKGGGGGTRELPVPTMIHLFTSSFSLSSQRVLENSKHAMLIPFLTTTGSFPPDLASGYLCVHLLHPLPLTTQAFLSYNKAPISSCLLAWLWLFPSWIHFHMLYSRMIHFSDSVSAQVSSSSRCLPHAPNLK